MATTLANLVIGSKTAANLQTGGPWVAAEWDSAVNRALEAFWVDCLAVNNTLRVTTVTGTITSSTTPYVTLPADFMSMLKVTRDPGLSTRRTVYRSSDELVDGEITYRLEGSKMYIDPLEASPGTYELRYNPLPTALTVSVDLDAELSQFREYFELHTAISALTSEQSSIADLAPRFAQVQARVMAWANRQRSSEPSKVRDVRTNKRRWR